MKPSDKKNPKLRLQVYLSRNGVCSRRAAMDIIQMGSVKVNGIVIREPSTAVNENDEIRVHDALIKHKKFEYVALNKPGNYMTTRRDRFADKTVYDLLPQKLHFLVPIGRLDKDTEGLLLMTNDGDLVQQMTHPKFHVEKSYFVKITRSLNSQNKDRLEKGIMIDQKKTLPAKIKNVVRSKNETELIIIIREGRKRQVKNMFAKVGSRVLYLKRQKHGPIELGNIGKGRWRYLNPLEVQKLKEMCKTLGKNN